MLKRVCEVMERMWVVMTIVLMVESNIISTLLDLLYIYFITWVGFPNPGFFLSNSTFLTNPSKTVVLIIYSLVSCKGSFEGPRISFRNYLFSIFKNTNEHQIPFTIEPRTFLKPSAGFPGVTKCFHKLQHLHDAVLPDRFRKSRLSDAGKWRWPSHLRRVLNMLALS